MSEEMAIELSDLLSRFGRIRSGEEFDILAGLPAEDVALLRPQMDYVARAHSGQFRRDNGRPYLDHVLQVWLLTRMSGGSLNAQLAALYHDVPEDCEATLAMSRQQIVEDIDHRLNAEVAGMVLQLTDPHPNMLFDEKIDRAAQLIGEARLIKLADALCNFYDVCMTPPANWDYDKMRTYVDYRCRMVQALAPTPTLTHSFLAHILIGMQQQWGPAVLPEAV